MYATYRSGSRQDRNSRHNARVETLYLEMLNAYNFQLRAYYSYLTSGEVRAIEGISPAGLADRVELFAHPQVQTAWNSALDRLGERADAASDMPEANESLHRSDLWLIYKECLESLTMEMRTDLGIPQHRARRQRLKRQARREEWKILHKWS
ncbi:hypothetical protein F1D05_22595 [Kribbella qitaiheensis]|uniref:Uncharacterized protein n=1 Tax=Kribbella qitaiheensis TaxID=1544730 RepID=A0A7G6X1S2_9ACTN|nr:hypothetical protein [Kribbella qitaiheensis]QNE20187.1 hypothetical protein F1D05_22595 [Kribbella qitaiheensis]